jgi:hypothetical protein
VLQLDGEGVLQFLQALLQVLNVALLLGQEEVLDSIKPRIHAIQACSHGLEVILRGCHSRNSVMPINQHLHVGVVVRQNLRVYRDRLSVENGVAYVPEMTIFPEQ